MSSIRPTGDTCVTGGDVTGALSTRSAEYIRGGGPPFNALSECCGECRTIVAGTSGGDADEPVYGVGTACVGCGDGTATGPYGLGCVVGKACGGGAAGTPFVNGGGGA